MGKLKGFCCILSGNETREAWSSWWRWNTQSHPRQVADLELCLLATMATILVQGQVLWWSPLSCRVPGWVLGGSGPRAQPFLVLVPVMVGTVSRPV